MQTVRISGNIDFRKINETRRMLLKLLTDGDGLELDMSDVHRIDSAGLAGLVEVVYAARLSGRTFRLRHVRDGVMRMIRFARLDRVLNFAENGTPFPSEGAYAP